MSAANPNQQNIWLEKATFSSSDLSGGSNGGLLAPEQAKEFLRVAIDSAVLMKECRQEFSNATKFEVPRISFGSRIMRPGTEGSRLGDSDRVKPTTGLVTLSTVLIRGEVPITDEVFEDNIEKDRLADTIMTMVAQAVGRDVEELIIKGDTARVGGDGDAYLDLLDGIIKQHQTDLAAAQKIDADAAGQPTTYDGILSKVLEAMPAKYRNDVSALRFYLPVKHTDGYERSLSARGTGLGDQAVIAGLAAKLAHRGVKVVPVPIMTGTGTINSVAVDYDKFGVLIDPKNIIVGWHRQIKVEKWRDPREGVTSFVISARVDVKVADPSAAVLVSDLPATLT